MPNSTPFNPQGWGNAADDAYNYYRYNQIQDGKGDPSKASTGLAGDGLFDYLDRAMDKQFDHTGRLMERSNFYRTKEGATQGQIDDQSYKRLDRSETGLNTRQTAQLETQKFIQNKGAELANWNKNNDKERAVSAFNRFR